MPSPAPESAHHVSFHGVSYGLHGASAGALLIDVEQEESALERELLAILEDITQKTGNFKCSRFCQDAAQCAGRDVRVCAGRSADRGRPERAESRHLRRRGCKGERV